MSFFKEIVELAKNIRECEELEEQEKRIITAKKFLISVIQRNQCFQVVVEAINGGSARLVAQHMFPKGTIGSITEYKR